MGTKHGDSSGWTRRRFLRGLGFGAVGLSAGKWVSFSDAASPLLHKKTDETFTSVLEQQIRRLCSCGFPRRMGLGEEEFASQIPVLPPAVLRSLKEEENLLLVVPENLVEAMEQMQLASLRILFPPSDKKEDNPTPSRSYWIAWRLVGDEAFAEKECLYEPSAPERPPNLVEGVHLAIQYPELLNNLSPALTSTSMPNGHTVILCHWRGKPQMSVVCRAAANRYAAMGGHLMNVRELTEENVS